MMNDTKKRRIERENRGPEERGGGGLYDVWQVQCTTKRDTSMVGMVEIASRLRMLQK